MVVFLLCLVLLLTSGTEGISQTDVLVPLTIIKTITTQFTIIKTMTTEFTIMNRERISPPRDN